MKRSISLSNRNLLTGGRRVGHQGSADDENSGPDCNQWDDEGSKKTSKTTNQDDDQCQYQSESSSYQFAGFRLSKSHAAAAAPSGILKLPSTAQLIPGTNIKNPNCAESTEEDDVFLNSYQTVQSSLTSEPNRNGGVPETFSDQLPETLPRSSQLPPPGEPRKPRLGDIVDTLNGRNVSESLRHSALIKTAERQRETASYPNLKETTGDGEKDGGEGVSGSGRKLNLNLFGQVTQKRLSTSHLKTAAGELVGGSLPGYASTSPSSVQEEKDDAPAFEAPSARQTRGVSSLTGMAKWMYPTHKSFIVDMNKIPTWEAAKTVSFERRPRHLGGDTPSTASTIDITTANPMSNAPSGGVYANVDNTGKPLTEEEYRQLEKRLAQEGQNGMLEQLYGDKNEKRNGGASKLEDSGSKGNGGEKEPADNKSSVYYPSSSPYHRANSKNSAQSTKARTSSDGTTNPVSLSRQ